MYLLEGDAVRSDIVYLAHPRTASVATKETLNLLGRVHAINSHHDYSLKLIPADALVFTTVRNPWDLFVSWWFKRSSDRSPFYAKPLVEFIPELVNGNPRYFSGGCLFYMAKYADHILCYEHLQAQFDLMLVQVGYAPCDLVVANRSLRPSRDYRDYYTLEARRWVAETFAFEIEKYGYQFD